MSWRLELPAAVSTFTNTQTDARWTRNLHTWSTYLSNVSWGQMFSTETLNKDENIGGKDKNGGLGGGRKQKANFLSFRNSATWKPYKMNPCCGVMWDFLFEWWKMLTILKQSAGASESGRKLKFWESLWLLRPFFSHIIIFCKLFDLYFLRTEDTYVTIKVQVWLWHSSKTSHI